MKYLIIYLNFKIYEDLDFISLELLGDLNINFNVLNKGIINYNGLNV
jgi:hypothetical protein